MSHTFTDHTKWMLSDEIFKKICDIWGNPDIDLFTNRLNHKVAEYASWKPDPESCFINAFSKNWKQFAYIYIYCFPLFTSIWKTLPKIRKKSLRALLITPMRHKELVPNDSSKYNKNTINIQHSPPTITRDKQQTQDIYT